MDSITEIEEQEQIVETDLDIDTNTNTNTNTNIEIQITPAPPPSPEMVEDNGSVNTVDTIENTNTDLEIVNTTLLKLSVNYDDNVSNTSTVVYTDVKDLLSGFEIDVSNISILVTKIIEVLNDSRYKKLTLEDKRDIMLEVVDKFIKNDIKLSGNDAVFASITVETLVNTVIDKSLGKTLKRANKKNNKITDKLSIGSIIESIVNKVTGIIDERDYSVREIIANISVIVGIVITLVEKYKNLTNVERKNITIRVIKKILTSKLEDNDLDDELKILIEITITTLPDMIDAVVSVAKGKGLKDSVSKVCCFNLLTQVISIVGKHK